MDDIFNEIAAVTKPKIMNLANKPVNAIYTPDMPVNGGEGLTYREWLIGMLASNPLMIKELGDEGVDRYGRSARIIIQQADAIIEQLEKEQK